MKHNLMNILDLEKPSPNDKIFASVQFADLIASKSTQPKTKIGAKAMINETSIFKNDSIANTFNPFR